jgi:hypothetical protein
MCGKITGTALSFTNALRINKYSKSSANMKFYVNNKKVLEQIFLKSS